MKEYYSHKADDGRLQTVDEHLRGCAKLCADFASAFGAEKHGRLAGMMHDIGKYSEGFQKRLNGGPKVDHSTAGALECALADHIAEGICVAGHHGGLPDFGNQSVDMPGDPTFAGRIRKAYASGRKTCDWKGDVPEAPSFDARFGDDLALSFGIRMLYSCLVDADFLDTEAFMTNGAVDRGGYDPLDELIARLDAYTSRWNQARTDIGSLRNAVRRDCDAAAEFPRGLFSLTVPTGGGKTVSSLAFALRHAAYHGMSRVIYVIPYTSVIEQNARVFREILGDKNVVEHHSEARSSYAEELTESEKRSALAAENWDAPVIVTTAVQFFESMYSNRPSRCRKLHNIADSVIIFDEVQSTPSQRLLPCMAAVGALVRYFGVSAVLCSATQPLVDDLLKRFAPDHDVREICRDKKTLYEKLRRVRYEKLGMTDLPDLAVRLGQKDQALCIVNRRRTAKELFDLLDRDFAYHLSTLMTPRDRKGALCEIRERLAAGLPCKVVSTSLIEAGVDLDFPCVFRELAGLDSVVQAAGRCNREGKRPADGSVVAVFELEDGARLMNRLNVSAAREALAESEDAGDPKTLERYFSAYRSLLGDNNIDSGGTVKMMKDGISGRRLPFATAAENFHLIEQNTFEIYVPCAENAAIIARLSDGSAVKNDYRAAGQYCVSVYEDHFRGLLEAGAVETISEGAAILTDTELYDEKTGLSLTAESGRAEFI